MEVTEKKLGLFDMIGDVSFDKKGLFHQSDEAERVYNIFMTNLLLSQHADCLLHINELNCRPWMSKKMHNDYLLHSLSKRRRFAKLAKPEVIEDIDLIQEIYGMSRSRAMQVLNLLSADQLAEMKASRYTGGSKKFKA